MPDQYHIPVMAAQVMQWLITDTAGVYVDATFGGGGHARLILQKVAPHGGRLFGFDADPAAIARAGGEDLKQFLHDGTLILRQAYFRQACQMLLQQDIRPVGVLMDLGVSSRQLDSDQIGLSYRQTMPLDMRFDPRSARPTAQDLVNRMTAGELATAMRRYADEPAAWKIAQAIEHARKGSVIATTTQLRDLIAGVIPDRFLTKTLSRVFQALRILVNDEMGELEEALDVFTGLLRQKGRLVVLTYHSLEDRLVKDVFRQEERTCVCPPDFPVCRCQKIQRLRVPGRKPLKPDDDEVAANPRSRSARLRVAEKTPPLHNRGNARQQHISKDQDY